MAAAHPDIVQTSSIGKSYQGRELWAAKISDNVATDEAEPEVLYDGLHHADEHMGLEMTLRILHWLADGYGTDPGIMTRQPIVVTPDLPVSKALNLSVVSPAPRRPPRSTVQRRPGAPRPATGPQR